MGELKKMFIVIAALIVGVVGLAMSLCGGTFTVSLILGAANSTQLLQTIPSLLLPVGSAIIGIVTIRKAFLKVKKMWLDELDDE
ncbi:MAG: hypothetical protein ABUS47_14325 [Steroidobacter sp.]